MQSHGIIDLIEIEREARRLRARFLRDGLASLAVRLRRAPSVKGAARA